MSAWGEVPGGRHEARSILPAQGQRVLQGSAHVHPHTRIPPGYGWYNPSMGTGAPQTGYQAMPAPAAPAEAYRGLPLTYGVRGHTYPSMPPAQLGMMYPPHMNPMHSSPMPAQYAMGPFPDQARADSASLCPPSGLTATAPHPGAGYGKQAQWQGKWDPYQWPSPAPMPTAPLPQPLDTYTSQPPVPAPASHHPGVPPEVHAGSTGLAALAHGSMLMSRGVVMHVAHVQSSTDLMPRSDPLAMPENMNDSRVRNRYHARSSRERSKHHMRTLEQHVDRLTKEKAKLLAEAKQSGVDTSGVESLREEPELREPEPVDEEHDGPHNDPQLPLETRRLLKRRRKNRVNSRRLRMRQGVKRHNLTVTRQLLLKQVADLKAALNPADGPPETDPAAEASAHSDPGDSGSNECGQDGSSDGEGEASHRPRKRRRTRAAETASAVSSADAQAAPDQ